MFFYNAIQIRFKSKINFEISNLKNCDVNKEN